MSDAAYDLAVIGGGPGGYVAAIKAAQLGLKVACIDKRAALGGTCLNIGCIPSKALLHSSHLLEEAMHGMAARGVKVSGVSLDLPVMMANKDETVATLTQGVAFLLKKNKVEHVVGHGRIAAPGRVAVQANGASRELTARHILIATGSDSTPLPGVAVDEERIVSSTGALALKRVPGHLLVVGAGYIGLEMGTVWRRLGAKVTVVEFLDRVTPGMDGEISKQFQRILTKQGMAFKLGMKVARVVARDEAIDVTIEPAQGGTPETLSVDTVLVAIGRRPFTDGLGLEEVGVRVDNRGRIETDHQYRTNIEGILAIGDVIKGPMLAHKAEEEGSFVAEMLAGQKPHLDYDIIPGVVYTAPEAASIGKTEEQLKADGVAYKAGRFPFSANSRARSVGATEGLVKILADAASDRVLGAHIIGPEAGTLIAEIAIAMEFGGSSEDIARTCHAHPTLEEAVKEAALAVHFKPIHI